MADKKKHTVLKVVGATAAAAAATYGGMAAYIFKEVFDLQKSSLYSGKGGTQYLTFTDSEKSEWFDHSSREDEYLTSYDGIKLHALRLANHPESHKWVILAFGPGSYDRTQLEYLYELDHAGLNVLAVDSRGCGLSEGKYTTLGWGEHYDLISWINYLVNVDPECRIALYGVSIGAAAVMNAVGDYLPSNVKCAIEEGGYGEIKDTLIRGITNVTKIDGKLLIPGIDLLCRQVLHFSMNDVSVQRQLKQACVPMMFVQGVESEFVSESMLFDNYYACGTDRVLVTAKDLTDDDSFTRYTDFIDKHLG